MQIDVDQCRITHYPAKVLLRKAEPVEQIDETIRRLVDKMGDIMTEQKGIGLAAPQAGVGLRLFVVSLDGTKENLRAFINPTVRPSGDMEAKEEGCLSVPSVYVKIKRYKLCEVTATDLNGHVFAETADGLYARALQHEFDHIEGITIVNRMGQASRIAHRRQIKKLEANAGLA
ncbi:peptide deformylase [Planctomycetota bacterium]